MIFEMKFSMRSFAVAAAVIALTLSPDLAVASGTAISHAPAADNFSRGKALYMKRVACSSCPAANGASNTDEARALIARLDGDEFELSAREKRVVKSYLNRRFGIKG